MSALLAGIADGDDEPDTSQWTDEARDAYHRERGAREEGRRLLADPENQWAWEPLDTYLDLKDFGPATGHTPAMREALRAIRQGAGGRLGTPRLL